MLDANDYGAYSPNWMIRQAAKHVPRENLEASFASAVEYVNRLALEKQSMDPWDALDLLGQLLVSGMYVPTAYPTHETVVPGMTFTLDDDEDDEERPITESDIEQFRREMEPYPEAEDPMDGWKA